VVSLCSPPKHNIKAEWYVDLFKNIGNRFIIGGDFNAKHTHWGSKLITTKGRELLKAINEYKCEVISTGKPTYSRKRHAEYDRGLLEVFKICGFHSCDCEQCLLLWYKTPVHTSQKRYYIPVTKPNQLMLCDIWGFPGGDYEEFSLLRCVDVLLLWERKFRGTRRLHHQGEKN
jgi:hypothetical protein